MLTFEENICRYRGKKPVTLLLGEFTNQFCVDSSDRQIYILESDSIDCMLESHTLAGEYTVIDGDEVEETIIEEINVPNYTPTGLIVESNTRDTCKIKLVPPCDGLEYSVSSDTVDELINSDAIREKGLYDATNESED